MILSYSESHAYEQRWRKRSMRRDKKETKKRKKYNVERNQTRAAGLA
jgi:hypothetical protein